MYNLLLVLGLAVAESDNASSFVKDLGQRSLLLPGVRNVLARPTLDGVYNGGDALLRLAFDSLCDFENAKQCDEWKAISALLTSPAIVTQLESAEFPTGQAGGASTGTQIYRVALFHAHVNPSVDRLDAFGRQTASLPTYIHAIRRWHLSTTRASEGARPWTHVWEQEYESLEDLNGPYMMHPAHWAHVERWFDTEYPEHLVDPMLVHSFCSIDRPAIIS